ncbi:MAG: TonB-dependent receptor [Bacteroidales bacterium]
MKHLLLLITLLLTIPAYAANFAIKGTVINKKDRLPVSYLTIQVWGTTIGTVTDDQGKFTIENMKPGIYRIQASGVGYKTVVTPEFQITSHSEDLDIEIEESIGQISEVSVVASPFRKSPESPLSNKKIGFREIEQSAGANRDISRVVQSFPGVASNPSGYRNDLIVRGGGPSENRYFLDGIEVPNINHFATQGASGGPVSIINSDFIQDIDFYQGAFPANRGNALSSVMNFSLKDGDRNGQNQSLIVGSSEVGISLDGHIGDKVTYLFSARQSYLQLLFKAIGLPFLPNFIDSQFKVKYRINPKNELTFIGLLGIDDMSINNDTTGFSDGNKYLWSVLGIIKQNTYTFGAVYKHYAGTRVQTISVSRNSLDNINQKYKDNVKTNPLLLNYKSIESENKVRFENTSNFGQFRLNEGLNYEFVEYYNKTDQYIVDNGLPVTLKYKSDMCFSKWGAFISGSYTTLDEKIKLSLGVRTDANTYNDSMSKWYKHISPRASVSYNFLPKLTFNANAGRYYQTPAYTVMGYKNNEDEFVNKDNLKMLYNDQINVGFEYALKSNIQISVEGFYKKYGNLMVSQIDSIPLFSKGNDYGVFGNEPVDSNGKGRSYGAEVFARISNLGGLNLMAAYTWVRSENFSPRNDAYIPSSWDNKYLFTLTSGYEFKNNWKLAMKYRLVGGAPYTPFDEETSSLKANWDATQRPVLDYAQYNAKRLKAFNQVDLRVDKYFFLKKGLMLGVYLDLQNALNFKYNNPDALLSTGVIENPNAPLNEQRYIMRTVKQEGGTILPSIGITLRL